MKTPEPDQAAPGDWSPEVDELRMRRSEAERLGGEDAVAKHHERGRSTIRERIASLVDPGSFQEVGKLTGSGEYDDQGRLSRVTPAPYVMGIAHIDDIIADVEQGTFERARVRAVARGGVLFVRDGTWVGPQRPAD